MDFQEAKKIVAAKTNGELLMMLAYRENFEPVLIDAAKAEAQKRGMEFNPAGSPPPPISPTRSVLPVSHGMPLWGIALAVCFGSVFILILITMSPALRYAVFGEPAAQKQRVKEINCTNNEKELGLAIKIYCGNNNDHFPAAATWCDAIKSGVESERVFKCPSENASNTCDYAFNARLSGVDDNKVDPSTVLIFEADGGWNASGGPELIPARPRHSRFIVALADGSVEAITPDQVSTLRWDP